MSASLQIDLQEGFFEETVVIRVAGEEIYRRDEVSTRLQIGLADRLELEVGEDDLTIEVSMPKRGLTSQVDVNVTETPFIKVNYLNEKLSLEPSAEQFRYG